MSNNIIDQAEQNINSYQAKTGTSRQSDSGKLRPTSDDHKSGVNEQQTSQVSMKASLPNSLVPLSRLEVRSEERTLLSPMKRVEN
jgi:hypothetical protein